MSKVAGPLVEHFAMSCRKLKNCLLVTPEILKGTANASSVPFLGHVKSDHGVAITCAELAGVSRVEKTALNRDFISNSLFLKRPAGKRTGHAHLTRWGRPPVLD